ncbi:MAG: hypothetical protein R3F19_34225 [Verrucomicrobiales bacterium]
MYVRTGGATVIQNNLIGRNLGGQALPNQIGVLVAEGMTSLTGNQIANDTTQGVTITTNDSVLISKGGIYDNGDSMARDGIRYTGVPAPLPPPNGLVIFRSAIAKPNGKHTVYIGLRRRSGGGSRILEIFSNPQAEEDEPQGKTFLFQKTIDTSKPYTDELEFDSSAAFMTAKSFTATLTNINATSEFSTIHGGRLIIPASIDFLEANPGPNSVGFIMGPSELFSLREAPTLHGPWERTTNGQKQTVMVDDPGLDSPIALELWTVPINPQDEEKFWRAELDWEKVLGEPVD